MANPLVAPSILSADFGKFSEEIRDVSKAGADWIHIDVMDGHFVPPITFGPGVVRAAKKACELVLDVHLMIERPAHQIAAFAEAGADFITVHIEACSHIHRVVQSIRELGVKAGVSINPGTPVSALESILADLDLVLVMSVNPGWGGQKFIPGSEKKISQLCELIRPMGKEILVEVDGGINSLTGRLCVNAGAQVLVSGSYIFGQKEYSSAIDSLKPEVVG